ncbi:hypothetical protein LJC16_00435 [Bacteroidales bacterium OttesenSCG-928-C19]|nr:hypothetical protein [Bacteroidales bacterium OttesenSCG-928-C19]
MRKRYWVVLFFLGIVAFSGCRKDSSDIKVKRFEQLLFSEESSKDLYKTLKESEADYKFLFNAPLEDPTYLQILRDFTADSVLREINDTVQKYYSNLSWLEKDLSKASAKIKKHFPEFGITTCYTLLTDEFDYFSRVMVADSFLAISMNMYVVSNFKGYDFGLPGYMITMLNKNEILPDCISAIGYHLLGNNEKSDSFLDIIIAQGKILYFMDEVIPNVADCYKIRYNKEQYEWCKSNESLIWSYILERNFLYETDFLKIRHLVNEGPHTQGFDGAPARLGEYIGWQIVRKYMSKNPTSLQDLFAETNAQKLLSDSGYKPKR